MDLGRKIGDAIEGDELYYIEEPSQSNITMNMSEKHARPHVKQQIFQ